MTGIGDLSPEELAELDKAANDPETGIAAQQAKAEAGNVDGNVEPCDVTPDGIRSRGGYFLMDSTWVAGGPWNGIPAEEMQGEANRRADIVEQMEAGTAFGFTEEGTALEPFATNLAGYFPASQAGRTNLQAREGEARLAYAIETGNDLAACLADPNFYVASHADAG